MLCSPGRGAHLLHEWRDEHGQPCELAADVSEVYVLCVAAGLDEPYDVSDSLRVQLRYVNETFKTWISVAKSHKDPEIFH